MKYIEGSKVKGQGARLSVSYIYEISKSVCSDLESKSWILGLVHLEYLPRSRRDFRLRDEI